MDKAHIEILSLFGGVILSASLGYAGFPEHRIAATIITGVLALILGGFAIAGLSLTREEQKKQSKFDLQKLAEKPSDAAAIAQLNRDAEKFQSSHQPRVTSTGIARQI